MNKSQHQALEDLAQVLPGATPQAFKAKSEGGEANAKLLRGKEFSAFGEFNISEMESVEVDGSKPRVTRHILQAGDVVLLARGSAIRAGFVTADVANNNVIASANFIIIRPEQDKVLGEVIAAYINSPVGRQALLKYSVGTAIQQVPASELRRFSLPVPSKEKQQIVADLYSAGINAYHETIALAEQQQNASNAAITTLLQGAG
jgi:restriction endonuclease S subunit